jgi:hypothetical protein
MAWVAGVRQAGHSGSLLPQMRTAQSMQKRLWPQGTSAAMASPSVHTTHSRATVVVGRTGAAGETDVLATAAAVTTAAVMEGFREPSEALGSSTEVVALLGNEGAVAKLVLPEKGGRVLCGGHQGRGPTGSGAPRRANGSSRPRPLGSGSVGEWRGVVAPLLRRAPAGGGTAAPLTAGQPLKAGRGAARSKGAQMVAVAGTVRSSARKSNPKSQSSGAVVPVGAPGPSPPNVKPPLPEPP